MYLVCVNCISLVKVQENLSQLALSKPVCTSATGLQYVCLPGKSEEQYAVGNLLADSQQTVSEGELFFTITAYCSMKGPGVNLVPTCPPRTMQDSVKILLVDSLVIN